MRKIFVLAAFILPLFMTACWESQEEPQSTMELEKDVIMVSAVGGADTIRVISNSRWRLNADQRDSSMISKWYVYSNAAGSIGYGNERMIINTSHNTVSENGEFQPRETVLTVELYDMYSEPIIRTITVRQEAETYRIALDKEEETVRADAGSLDVKVNAMGPWKIEKPDEITYSVKDNVCTIRYPKNTSEEGREFLLTFSVTQAPYPSATLKIIQEKGTSVPDPEDPEDPEDPDDLES